MNLLSREGETICAPITAPAAAGVGVIRVSGNKAFATAKALCPFLPKELESHKVYYGWLEDKDANESIDEVLVTTFEEGRSFTGEETVEISCHGSLAIQDRILNLLFDNGCRPAERGEFTFRAFSHGRIDLVQAESILSLIQSKTEQSARLSLRQLQGDLSREVQKIEDNITWVLANIEASIDFSTEDIDVLDTPEIQTRVAEVASAVKKLVGSYRQTRMAIEGLKVALVGAPNAGKSSLLNALVGQEKAIVTEVPGTTRDLIESQLKLENGLITLVDTAGLRETNELVEGIGIKAAFKTIKEADLVCYLIDLNSDISQDVFDQIKQVEPQKLMILGSKSDLNGAEKVYSQIEARLEEIKPSYGFTKVSSRSGEGLSELKSKLNNELANAFVDNSAVLIQKRHFELLTQASEQANKALQLLQDKTSPELVALELQESLSKVFELLGKRYDDQVMDRVFKEFCIGK